MTIALSAMDVVAGIALLWTPFASIGAGMIGAGIGAIAGGYISEAVGGSFETGAVIGGIVGGIVGAGVYKGVMAIRALRAPTTIEVCKEAHCFIAGTLVACKDESEDGDGAEVKKPIEDIKVGDDVWAYDEETKEWGWRKVVRLYRNETWKWCDVEIETDGADKTNIITSTPGHKYHVPFNTENRNPTEQLEHASYEGLSEKWVSAKDLRVGDKVLLSDGRYGVVKSVTVRELKVPEVTYNFEVEGCHTYCVGENGVLVHNAGCGANPDLYRGGEDMTLRQGDYAIKDGLVVPGKEGVSVNIDPSKVARFGGAHKVVSVPDGLIIAQKGLDLGHYVIRPAYAMPLNQYQSLLYQVKLIPFS